MVQYLKEKEKSYYIDIVFVAKLHLIGILIQVHLYPHNIEQYGISDEISWFGEVIRRRKCFLIVPYNCQKVHYHSMT